MTAPCPRCGRDAPMQPGMRCATLIVKNMETGEMENRGAKTHFMCFNCPRSDGKTGYPFMVPYEDTLSGGYDAYTVEAERERAVRRLRRA